MLLPTTLPKILNRAVFICGVNDVTQNNILAALEAETGSKFEVTHVDVKSIRQGATEALQKGDWKAATRGLTITSQFDEEDSAANFWDMVDNETVGVAPVTVREAVRTTLASLQFLRLDCQSDLSASITKLNEKSKLFVLREAPQTLLPKLFKSWRITHLVFERDTDPYAKERDARVIQSAREAGVEVVAARHGRTLYDPDELVRENGGKPTMSITQVQHAAEKLGPVPKPLPTPESLPDPGDLFLDFEQTQPSPEPDINNIQRSGKETSYTSLSGPNHDFAVPTMSELGLKPATTPHRGGETRALAALDAIIANEHYTTTFSKPSTAPTAFFPQATTLLSPHHHFGSISVRLVYHRVQAVITKPANAKKASTIPTNLIGQLLFRDMYFAAQAALGYRFAQTHNNPRARFVPWHLPSKIDPANNLITGDYIIDSPRAERWFQRWKFGKTGFPWIDALMRQLRYEGWMHHLGRHAVACFLTRGGCYVHWERGAEVFEEWLIDHETSANTGNW
ncbi:MAG: hypothetical protein LQ338_008237, partial [Usnochroma carphineum]